MAKFLPWIQVQKDLRKMLQEAHVATKLETVCNNAKDDTFGPLWDAAFAHPSAELLCAGQEPPPNAELPARVAFLNANLPKGNIVFITPRAVMELVKEARAIQMKAEELLNWLVEKKLDQ